MRMCVPAFPPEEYAGTGPRLVFVVLVGGVGEQTVDIGGSDQQLIWNSTFTVSQTVCGVTTTWQVAVIDVDQNNDDDLSDAGEDGYFLVFPDGLPPADIDMDICRASTTLSGSDNHFGRFLGRCDVA